jgi:hypothetical protein
MQKRCNPAAGTAQASQGTTPSLHRLRVVRPSVVAIDVVDSPTSPSAGLRCLAVCISARDNDTCQGAKVWFLRGQ